MNWRGLICEEADRVSIGRVMLWLVFIMMTFFWFSNETREISTSLVTCFEWLLGYNFGKKLLDSLPGIISNLKGTK